MRQVDTEIVFLFFSLDVHRIALKTLSLLLIVHTSTVLGMANQFWDHQNNNNKRGSSKYASEHEK